MVLPRRLLPRGRVGTTADRVKLKHLRHDPRAAPHVRGGDVWSFAVAVAVAEGEAETSGITTVPGDAVGRELLGMIPESARPEDEDAFLEQLVAERRLVIRLKVNRLYGTALGIEGREPPSHVTPAAPPTPGRSGAPH